MSERLTLTRVEAAEIIGISRAKIDELIACGAIPSLKIGGRRLFLRSSLEAWLLDQEFLGVHRDGVA